jgi:GAF domain
VPVSNVARILATVLAASRRGEDAGASLPQRLCTACAAALPVSGVGLALMTKQGPAGLVAATDGPATTREELQFTLGEGPCVDASRHGHPVLQPELRRTAVSRWPGFGPAALDAGIEAIFAFPLLVGGIRLGVLDLYRDTPGALTSPQMMEALGYADAATRVLLHLQDQMPLGGGLHPDLADLDGNRARVHQATGMVAVQAAVGLTEALLLLRARAYSTGRSINDIAEDVLDGTLHFPPVGDDDNAEGDEDDDERDTGT